MLSYIAGGTKHGTRNESLSPPWGLHLGLITRGGNVAPLFTTPVAICLPGVLSGQVISTLAKRPSAETELLFLLLLHLSPPGEEGVFSPSPSRGVRAGDDDGGRARWPVKEGRVKAATVQAIRNNEDEMGCRSISTLAAALLVGQSVLGSRRNARYVRIFSPKIFFFFSFSKYIFLLFFSLGSLILGINPLDSSICSRNIGV